MFLAAFSVNSGSLSMTCLYKTDLLGENHHLRFSRGKFINDIGSKQKTPEFSGDSIILLSKASRLRFRTANGFCFFDGNSPSNFGELSNSHHFPNFPCKKTAAWFSCHRWATVIGSANGFIFLHPQNDNSEVRSANAFLVGLVAALQKLVPIASHRTSPAKHLNNTKKQ